MLDRAIDVHAHCVPRSFFDRIAAEDDWLGVSLQSDSSGDRWVFEGGGQTAPIEPYLLDVGARIDRMDAAGIAVQLLSGFIDTGAHQLQAGGRDYARAFNDALAESVAAYPDRLLGLGTLPLNDVGAAVDELNRLIGDLGFVGVEVPARGVVGAALEPFWAEAARLGAVVLVHPEASTTSPLPYFLGNFVGNPAETTSAALSLILSGTLERHPGLSVVLVHGGGFLPYQFGRAEHGFAIYGDRFGAAAVTSPREQLRLLHYDTVLHGPEALAYLVDVVGHDRVVLGTDDPFLMGDAAPLQTVAALGSLGAAQRDEIAWGNAARLLERVGNDRWKRLRHG